MENFFVRRKEVQKFASKSYLYDMNARVEDGAIHFEDIHIELPFIPVYLRNLPFDFFLISDDRNLYRINKHKREIDNLGYLTDSIRAVECASDRIIIATERELLLFNAYFALVKSKPLRDLEHSSDVGCCKRGVPCCGQNRHCARGVCPVQDDHASSSGRNQGVGVEGYRVVCGEDLFGYIEPGRMTVYNLDLDPIGVVDEDILDAVYISQYNKFACATARSVKFIEPNGLEHGDPLDARVETLENMNVCGCNLLVCSKGSEVSVFYMKNFFWYKKLMIYGDLLRVENNAVVVSDSDSITKLFIYRERSPNFVIDGHRLYYTNLGRAIIPPPFYFKCIEVGSQIRNFHFDGLRLCISDQNEANVFLIDKKDNIKKVSTLGRLGDDFVMVGDAFLSKVDNSVEVVGDGSEQVRRFAERVGRISKDIPILKLYSFGGIPACLFYNGTVLFDDVYRLTPSLECSFDLQVSFEMSRMYLLGSGSLHAVRLRRELAQRVSLEDRVESMGLGVREPSTLLSGVTSYLLHRNYLLYISKGMLTVLDCKTGVECRSYSEDGTEILAVKDNKAILYTRFGTLETATNKLFSKAIIRSLISQNRPREAAQLCDLNHVSYSIFFESGPFDASNLCQLDDSHTLSFFEAMNMGGLTFLLENEYLERLERNFNPSVVLRNKCFEVVNPECVCMASVSHIFDLSKMPLKIRDTVHLRHCDFLNEQRDVSNLIDGKPSIDALNSFLKNLDTSSHLTTIVNVLVALNRVDLCFYLPNPQKVIKTLLTRLSPETVSRESIRTMDIDKIISTHKACQRDYASFLAFYNSCKNAKRSLSDYLEDRAAALFYMLEDSAFDCAKEFAVKHGLLDHLLMYSYHSVFNFNFYEFVAQHKEPLDSFYLYCNSRDKQRALDVAAENVFWREAIELDPSSENCSRFLDLLIKNSMFLEAGSVCEKNVGDYSNAIRLYLKGRGISETLGLVMSPGLSEHLAREQSGMTKSCAISLLRTASSNYLKNDLAVLRDLVASLNKYRERLLTVRDRLNENMGASQTSFSYSSAKSSKRALIKDRPGGFFENEYVLNKIREIVLAINNWRDQTEPLIKVFLTFGEPDLVYAHDELFCPIKETLRAMVEELWDYKRTDCDVEKPVVPKPELSRYFD